MKTRILTTLFIVFISCKNVTKNEQAQIAIDSTESKVKVDIKQKEYSISNGIWISTIDSLSSVEIKDNKWIFKYINAKTDSDDIYDYLITESVFDEDNSIIGGGLVLSHKSDTLKYGIDYISDKNMTLIYLPRGNFHQYQKK
ncbi:hypothetical protein V6251_11225 [Olleya sp. Ti.3.14]|uniref:hypothetical protein n=1 Tax=Olleya sp. Ti.3.14 TaxID=3121297 RepID=UPI00311FEDF2